MDLENIITLVFVFVGLRLNLNLVHHIANFRRFGCKSFAIWMFRLKADFAVSSANWDRVLFVLRCWKIIDVNQEK